MKKIIGACVGDCVHVAGVYKFLEEANKLGYETNFMGPAVDVDKVINEIKMYDPDVVAISYRLTPENGLDTLNEFKSKIKESGLEDKEFVLGGLPLLVEKESEKGFFSKYFKGGETEETIRYLKGAGSEDLSSQYSNNILDRIQEKKPFPVLRHHFGLPSYEDTRKGIEKIADSGCLDVISLGTDQNTQAYFFHPEKQSKEVGAGGVPVRNVEEYMELFEATKRGNNPLMRTYAGTSDLIRLAEMYEESFGNAWAAVPIFWFNAMDGRGPMELEESIRVHFELIKWNAQKGIPVETLEAHHWSMRDSSDEVAVAAGYLGAEICKRLGVNNFISQYMFNTPPQTPFKHDLAKMLAQKEMIESLIDDDFNVYTQTRTGLFSHPVDMDMAKGQLASSTMLQMQLNPDIIHVVSYSEANHAATPENVIESCNIVKQVIKNSLDMPDMSYDPIVIEKKQIIQSRAKEIVEEIKLIGDVTEPRTLYEAAKQRILFAPQSKKYFEEK